MIKVRVPVMVKDPDVAESKEIRIAENFVIESEEFFLDGPISRRMAILDLDPKSGKLVPVAR